MDRQNLAGRLPWLGAGLALGWAAARWLANRPGGPGRIGDLSDWEQALRTRYGVQTAALLAARTQARYETLFPARPRFSIAALQDHVDSHILPGLALYQTLTDTGLAQPEALAVVEDCFHAHVQALRPDRLAWLVEHLPGGFTTFRAANHVILRALYPEQGWKTEWVEDSPRRVAYDMTGCLYLNVLTAYGAPELTRCFCRQDDWLYGGQRAIAWERTETLGRGDARCNFAFRNLR